MRSANFRRRRGSANLALPANSSSSRVGGSIRSCAASRKTVPHQSHSAACVRSSSASSGSNCPGSSSRSRSSSGQPRVFCGRRCASAPACSRPIGSPPLSPMFILILRNDSAARLPFPVFKSVTDQLIQTHNDAFHSFNRQVENGNCRDLLGRHALPVVKPEDPAVPLAGGRLAEQIVDFPKQQPPLRFFLNGRVFRQRGLIRTFAGLRL